MDMHYHPHEYGRFEQILSQFLLKSLHIILDARVPSIRPGTRSAEVKKTDKWFNLILGDRPAALDNLSFWHRSLMEPMIIDIILAQEAPSTSYEHNLPTTLGVRPFKDTVIERWIVQYENLRSSPPQTSDLSYKKTYKKSIILLRSLYQMTRLLPANKAFRKLASSSQTCEFDINYKVSSFSSPFSRAEEELMKHYTFVPVDAHQGRFSISVTYRENLSDFNLETVTSFPPQIITDYVGSPMTDPLRAFPSSFTEKGVRATSFPLRGMQSPSSAPLQRPHSWTSGLLREVSRPENQPFVGSPPPSRILNEFPSPATEIHGQRILNYGRPSHHRAASFEDYQLSPPFSSPSPSPSPPTYLSGGSPAQTRFRSETAPVSIPHPVAGRSSRRSSPNLSDPNRLPLPPLSPRSTKHCPSSQDSPSPIKSYKKQDLLRAGEPSLGTANPVSKLSKDARDDSGRFSGLLSSSGSPHVGFSRSSSRLSFQDDLDECDFSCPFIVDDVDTSDSPSSQNLEVKKDSEFSSQSSSTARRSQSAVGALVHMLRTAPPLCQDLSCYSPESSKTEVAGESDAASGFFATKRASDALEELRACKELKDLLLSKSASGMLVKDKL